MHNVSIFVGGATLLFCAIWLIANYKTAWHNIKWCFCPISAALKTIGIVIIACIVGVVFAIAFAALAFSIGNFLIWAYHLFIQ
jgi:hypothetical protein